MCVHGTLHEALARSLALSLVRRTVILACWIEWSGIAMHATNDDNCHEPHRNRNEPAGCRASSVLASWNEIKPKNQLHTHERERERERQSASDWVLGGCKVLCGLNVLGTEDLCSLRSETVTIMRDAE